MEADHRRAQAHPAGPHLRGGYRRAGGGGDQAVAAAEGAGRRKRADACKAAELLAGARAARPGAEHQMRQLADRAGFLRGQQLGLLDKEEQYRINAFDWQREFRRRCLHSGGFDAVIGNPPYGASFEESEDCLLSQ